ncbi:MAG: hypothetical protein E7263_12085 [Lachnospiraceae bacterium]|nr:hypothetical protein [Lachnospiraceae bacterium]
MGFTIREVIVIVSSDADLCDITVNFNINQFYEVSKCDLMNKFTNLFERILYICKIVKSEYVLFGYEPAGDDDMMLLKFNYGHIEIYNESLHSDYISNIVYEIVRSTTFN